MAYRSWGVSFMMYLTGIICTAYVLAIFFRFFERIFGRTMAWHGLIPLATGIVLHLVALMVTLHTAFFTQAFPISLVAMVASALLVGICAGLEVFSKDSFFSLIIMPLAVPLLLFSTIFDTFLKGPIYQGWVFFFHVFSAVSGECFFTLAGISGAVYLVVVRRLKQKNRFRGVQLFPPLARLDSLMSWFSLFGFLLFTMGVVLGGIWSYQTFGSIRLLETKRLWAFAVWLIFAVQIAGRRMGTITGRRMAVLILAGFITSLSLIFAGDNQLHWYP